MLQHKVTALCSALTQLASCNPCSELLGAHAPLDTDSLPPVFCTDSTENIVLQVIAQDPLVEGDNVTLKCVADGNPAPTSFNFHLKVHILTRISSNAQNFLPFMLISSFHVKTCFSSVRNHKPITYQCLVVCR